MLNSFGIDILPSKKSPRLTMLGLKSCNINTVIDCGANEGQFALKALRVFPKAKIYCFEPLEEPFNKLQSWVEKQNGRVSCFNLALGDYEGEVQMYRHDEHSPSSSILKSTALGHKIYPQTISESLEKVQITTLDNSLKVELERMSPGVLLKLDVQGFEDKVIFGAPKILAAASACILEVCLEQLYEGQANFFDLVALLKEAGFKYAGNLDQAYGNDGRVVFFDAVFIK